MIRAPDTIDLSLSSAGRIMGSARSEAKTLAAQRNGRIAKRSKEQIVLDDRLDNLRSEIKKMPISNAMEIVTEMEEKIAKKI